MKITLEFNTDNDLSQEREAKRAMSATGAYICLYRIRESILDLMEKDINGFCEFLTEFDDILYENGINLDDLE